jgi:hypothetical protein
MYSRPSVGLPTFNLTSIASPIVVIGSLTIIGFFLRLYHLGYKPLWFDEAVLFWLSQGSFQEVIAQNTDKNSAPFFFALIINLISRLNDSESVLRGIPWLAGVAAIPMMYLLSSQVLPRHSAYFVTFLVTISSTLIWYSQQLREYSITFLLAALMLVAFYNFLREPNQKNVIVLALVWILSILTQYGLALLILTLNLIFAIAWLFSKERKVDLIAKWGIVQVLGMGAVVVVYQLSLKNQMRIGWGATSTSNYLQSAYWDGAFSSLPKFAVKNTLDIFSFAYPTSEILSYSVAILFLLICSIGVVTALLARKWIVLAMFLLPMGSTLFAAVAQIYPYHGQRHTIFLLPMIYVSAGFGFSYLWDIDKKKLFVLPMILILGFGGLRSTNLYLSWHGQENIKPIVETLSASYEPGDRIYVYYGAEPAFRYYYRSNLDNWINGIFSREDPTKYLQQLDDVLQHQYRVWMVFSHCFSDECELIPAYASSLRDIRLVTGSSGVRLYLAE